jgi:acyl dehydratase
MLQAGLLATFATDWLGPENVRRFAVRFKEQVWPGDLLTCQGSITSIDEVDGEQRATVALQCLRQTGGVAIDATAEFVI